MVVQMFHPSLSSNVIKWHPWTRSHSSFLVTTKRSPNAPSVPWLGKPLCRPFVTGNCNMRLLNIFVRTCRSSWSAEQNSQRWWSGKRNREKLSAAAQGEDAAPDVRCRWSCSWFCIFSLLASDASRNRVANPVVDLQFSSSLSTCLETTD